jgi:Raf kinase inhibitor-like YbhB/YbcL family protein
MNFLLLILTLIMNQPLFTVKCTAFADSNYIPPRYTCEGLNINPGLVIENIPQNTKTLALVMEDPDPAFGTFDHWVVWNIPPTHEIKENSIPGKVGKNSRDENKYTGPCPPSGVHKYHFRVYALNETLHLSDNTTKLELLKAMQGHVLATAETTGLFHKATQLLGK